MRTPCVTANWKMFKTAVEARSLIDELKTELLDLVGVDVVLCPPFTALMAVADLLEGSKIGVGAQNMFWEESGAYTGEVAPGMIAEFSSFVILGHSERRTLFGETNVTVNRKARAALGHGLTPIVCVGETLEENEAGLTAEVVNRQVTECLAGIELHTSAQGNVPLMIAYEPVWAIGTGRAATAHGANAVVADYIRPAVERLYDTKTAQALRVLYGGSVKGANAAEYFAKSDIDGALVGGASLNAVEFAQIVRAAAS